MRTKGAKDKKPRKCKHTVEQIDAALVHPAGCVLAARALGMSAPAIRHYRAGKFPRFYREAKDNGRS